jgi:hypothetical protein
VLHPVAHIVEFEPAHETRKAGAHLVHAKRIEFSHPVCLSPDEKGRLSDFCAFEGGGQIEIRLGAAVVVQTTVKASALELRDVMSNVVSFRPRRQGPWSRTMKAPCGIHRAPTPIGRSRS